MDEVVGLRGLVVELRADGVHDYRLLSVPRAAAGLAAWMQRAVATVDWGERADRVVVDVVRHRPGEPLEAAGLSLRAGADEGSALLFGGRRRRYDARDLGAVTEAAEELLRQAGELADGSSSGSSSGPGGPSPRDGS
ncbi:MAG TPA: hypothetical protein VFM09_13120 [Marmoricola sp.]|nr:hypothetical protein [Marmoricola sp.]